MFDYFKDDSIGEEGIMKLSEGLMMNSSLTNVDLSCKRKKEQSKQERRMNHLLTF